MAKEIKSARDANKDPAQSSSSTCDFSKARLPSTDEPLPSVPEGQKLLHVTIGRGIQVCFFFIIFNLHISFVGLLVRDWHLHVDGSAF